MRRATGATQGGASASTREPGYFARRRASSACAISMSPIQLGATTRMRGRLMALRRCALVQVFRAAIRAERLAVLYHVEEHARMPRPQRRALQRAVQRQVLFRELDLPRGIGAHFLPFFIGTGVSQCLCLRSLPVTTSKNAFCRALVTGPALPAPMTRPSSSRIGVTSAAVPVKKHSSAM